MEITGMTTIATTAKIASPLPASPLDPLPPPILPTEPMRTPPTDEESLAIGKPGRMMRGTNSGGCGRCGSTPGCTTMMSGP
jgi:hypothetical protein